MSGAVVSDLGEQKVDRDLQTPFLDRVATGLGDTTYGQGGKGQEAGHDGGTVPHSEAW